MSAAGEELEALLALMRTLRDPKDGCPWDREQDFASIAPFTIEEAYEVADAIGRGDLDRLRDELGDLLFQVVFHARMAEEAGRFDFAAVARGDPRQAGPAASTRLRRAQGGRCGTAARVVGKAEGAASAQPLVCVACWRMYRARCRHWRARPSSAAAPRRVGFDWPDAAGVRAKLDEELAEIDAALAAADRAQLAEEIGDLLFTLANWARHLEVDAEDALRRAALKFEQRFRVDGARGRAGRTLAE